MTEKTPLSHEVVCFQMLDFETSSSKSEVSKSNSWKITFFSKTTSLQSEPFLTMFYTINLSPLLVTKKGFMIIIILSNYQQCPLPLSAVLLFCVILMLIYLPRCFRNLMYVIFGFEIYSGITVPMEGSDYVGPSSRPELVLYNFSFRNYFLALQLGRDTLYCHTLAHNTPDLVKNLGPISQSC